jgi:hypothetical protein
MNTYGNYQTDRWREVIKYNIFPNGCCAGYAR